MRARVRTGQGAAVVAALGLLAAACGGGGSSGSPADVAADGGQDALPADVSSGTADSVAASDAGSDVEPVCVPACPLAACAADDGCAGLCAPCPVSVSCDDCPLRLEVVDRVVQDGIVRRFSVALSYLPEDGDPLPELADVRIGVAGPVKLLSVTAGQPLLDAGKELLGDPNTGEDFQILAEGSVIRVVIASVDTVHTIGAGEWLRYELRLGGAFEVADEPAVLSLLRGEPIFAPPPAEATLWGPGLDQPVAVWPDEGA